jgi:hypothetical protein
VDFRIDFGNALPLTPAADAPLHASVAGVALALGPDECVFRPADSSERHVMTFDVLATLDATRRFRTLDEHAREVALGIRTVAGREDAARAMLEQLMRRGLLVSADDLIDRLARAPLTRGTPAPFRGVAIRTGDRPEQLARLLATLADHEARHAPRHRYLLIDDSRDAANVARNAALARDFAARAAVEVQHVTPSASARACAVWRRAVPHAAAAISTLLERDGEDPAAFGGGRALNLALLLAAGARVALLDDDCVLPVHGIGAADADGRIRLGPAHQPRTRFHDDLGAALADGTPWPGDPFVAQLDWCGRTLGEILAGDPSRRPRRADLRGLELTQLAGLSAATPIAATVIGHRGDSAAPDRDWLFTLGPEERAAFTRDRERYLATLARPCVTRVDREFAVARHGQFAPFLVDGAGLVAPTLASGGNEERLFGALAAVLRPDARVLHVPATIGREQPATAPPRLPRATAERPALADFIADWLGREAVEIRAADPARRLLAVADRLSDLAAADRATRATLLGEYLDARRADRVRRLQEAFASAPDAPVYWQADVRERIEVNGRALIAGEPPRLAGWPDTLDEPGCADRLARELDAFADALRGWPSLHAHAVERGARVLDDVA